MTRRLASDRAGLRVRAGCWLTLPLPLLALAAAAFALAPSCVNHRAGVRVELGLLPSTRGAFVAAPATHASFAVTGPAVSGGDRAAVPRRAGQRRRAEP